VSGQATGQVGAVHAADSKYRADEPLLTKAQLADEFSVTPKTVQRWIKQGAPHMRVGRVVRLRQSEVERWVKGEQVKAA
jgi:excisionase family DNA binding protein